MEFTDDAVHVSNSEYLLELKDNSLIIRNDQLDMVCSIPKPKSMKPGISIARQEIQRDHLAYLDEDNTIFVIDIATCETIATLQVETASSHQYSNVEPLEKEYYNPCIALALRCLLKMVMGSSFVSKAIRTAHRKPANGSICSLYPLFTFLQTISPSLF